MKKIGIFGGTFNPPHIGHFSVAESILSQLNLDKIIFVPAYISPLKNNGEENNAIQRLEMVKLKIKSNSRFEVSSFEIEKGEISFTIDTVIYLKNIYNDAELYLIMGFDAYDKIHLWKDYIKLCELVTVVVMNRGEYKVTNKLNENVKFISVPNIPISSTMIRKKILQDEKINEYVDEKILSYINNNNLYKKPNE